MRGAPVDGQRSSRQRPMDPDKALIKRIVQQRGARHDIVVMLATRSPNRTPPDGPTQAGSSWRTVFAASSTASVSSSWCVFEDEVKERAEASVYEAEIDFFEMTWTSTRSRKPCGRSRRRGVA